MASVSGENPLALASEEIYTFPLSLRLKSSCLTLSIAMSVPIPVAAMTVALIPDSPIHAVSGVVKYTRLQSCVLHKIAQTGSSLSGVAVFGGIAAVCGIAMLIARKNRR